MFESRNYLAICRLSCRHKAMFWVEDTTYLRALSKANNTIKSSNGIYCMECNKDTNNLKTLKIKNWKIVDIRSHFKSNIRESVTSFFKKTEKVEKGQSDSKSNFLLRALGL